MANDNRMRIDPERFKKMIKSINQPGSPAHGLYFENDDGTPIYSTHPPKHKLQKNRQKDIAEMLGITTANLSRNVNGVSAPSARTLAFFKKYYGVQPEWLCGILREEDKTLWKMAGRILEDSLRIEKILKELLRINGIECVCVEDMDAPTTVTDEDGLTAFGYTVGGVGYTNDEFHRLAVKVRDYVKFEVDHNAPRLRNISGIEKELDASMAHLKPQVPGK